MDSIVKSAINLADRIFTPKLYWYFVFFSGMIMGGIGGYGIGAS